MGLRGVGFGFLVSSWLMGCSTNAVPPLADRARDAGSIEALPESPEQLPPLEEIDGNNPDNPAVPAGPWPIANITYGTAQGILETPILGITTDETENIWIATPKALYVMRPGESRFKRFTAADGLHLAENPAFYCDNNFPGKGVDDEHSACGDTYASRCPIAGAASAVGITEVEGGAANEVFVGYAGVDEGTFDWCDPNRHSGKLDRVQLKADGTLDVVRFDLVSNNHGAMYWHNRTVQRMLYDHSKHRGELYVGANHGVVLLRPNKYRPVREKEWFDTAYQEYMGDHIHPRVCDLNRTTASACNPNSEANQLMGDWRGLAIAPDGDLWVAGKWSAGKVMWTADLKTWYSRVGERAFYVAFGDPYPQAPNEFGFLNEPVFKVETEGDPVHLSSVAVGTDGRVWFGSGPMTTQPQVLPDGRVKPVVEYGLAAWTGRYFQVFDPIKDLGLPERWIRDLVALPDNRLVIGTKKSGLYIWHPVTGEMKALRAGQGIPDDAILRLKLDARVNPPAIQVATQTGATVLRVY
ncbi:MAG: WD40 repeat domain-containing protein [Myxococcaceae bacterium]